MKLLFALFLMISASQSIYSQTKLIIKSSDNKSLLPFATISNVSKKVSFSADKSGLSEVQTSIGDTLLITYVGYLDQYFQVKQNHYLDTIFMKRFVKDLPEVFIKKCKKFINYSISTDNENKPEHNFSGFYCTKGNYNGKIAVKIQDEQHEGKLQSISFWLKSLWNKAPQNAFHSPFIISFYGISELNLPGELLYQNPLVFSPKKGGKQILDVDSINIWLPAEGIFVSFEYIMDEKYQWEEKMKDTTIIRQGVVIDGQYSNKNEIVYYDYNKGCWSHSLKDNSTVSLNRTIRIEAIIRYCK